MTQRIQYRCPNCGAFGVVEFIGYAGSIGLCPYCGCADAYVDESAPELTSTQKEEAKKINVLTALVEEHDAPSDDPDPDYGF